MPSGVGLALGGGALLGGIAGAGDKTQTTTRNVAPASAQERDLQQKSFESYLQQLALAQQGEAGIQGGQGIQTNARDLMQGILTGSSFGLTPEETQQIHATRQAQIDLGQQDVNKYLENAMRGVNQSAAERGVRGQALSELQGRAVQSGAEQMGRLVGQANLTAAQQAQQMPYQRLGIQGGLANQNANFMENLRQQAIANRQALQSPVLMQSLLNERLGSASETSTSPGSFGSVIGGALGGAGAGASLYGALNGKTQNKAQGGRVEPQRDPTKRKEIEDFARGARQGGSWSETWNTLRDAIMGPSEEEKKKMSQQKPLRMADGGFVPGMASFPGDTMLNDTVPVEASPGELIIPRAFAKDPKLAKAFVEYQFRQESGSGGGQ